MNKTFSYTIILLFGIYVSLLFFNGELTIYIHPRYIYFTFIGALICLLVGALGIWNNLKHTGHESEKFDLTSALLSTILFLTLLVGIFFPAKPLSSATVSQRSLDLNTLSLNEKTTNSVIDNFLGDTSTRDIGDWVTSISLDPDYELYEGKKVDVTGFVFKDSTYPENRFLLARFVITCCAVDVRPVGLYVETEEKFDSDKWIRVQGKFGLVDNDGEKELVIIPEKIESTEMPEKPYIY